MPGHDRERGLHPVLVSGGGRSGTTLLMLLLGSSPRVAFDRVYPFEHRYLTYLLRWAQLLRPGRAPEGWTQVAMVARADEMMGPIPWERTEMLGDPESFWRACFLEAWAELSARAQERMRAGQPGVEVTHYAEKTPPWVSSELGGLLPFAALLPVRDPRDVFLSVVAFVAKRGRAGFGMKPGEPPIDFARRFVRNQRRRLREARGAERTGAAAVVRYEHLVADLAGEAERLGTLLGLDLDPAAVSTPEGRHREHITSASPEASVGRWKREMEPEVLAVFTDHLAAELEALGYEV